MIQHVNEVVSVNLFLVFQSHTLVKDTCQPLKPNYQEAYSALRD